MHPNQIGQWRKKLLKELPALFSERGNHHDKDREELEAELYRQIGQLKVELEWLKKNLSCSAKEMRELIDPGYLEIYRQCALLGLSRSGYYYQPHGESPLNLRLMNLIDSQYTKGSQFTSNEFTGRLETAGVRISMDGRGRAFDNIFLVYRA